MRILRISLIRMIFGLSDEPNSWVSRQRQREEELNGVLVDGERKAMRKGGDGYGEWTASGREVHTFF